MDKNMFWHIIDKAREAAESTVDEVDDDYDRDMYYYLLETLKKCEDSDLFRWHQIFDLYFKSAYKNKLLAASYVIPDWRNNVEFTYFRVWLITKGKEAYMKYLREPDDLADIEIDGYYDIRFKLEKMLYVAKNAYICKHYLGLYFSESDCQYYGVMNKYPAMVDEEKAEITSDIIHAPDIDIDLTEGNDLITLLPKMCKKYAWKGKKVYLVNPNGIDYSNVDLYGLLGEVNAQATDSL